MANDNGNLSLFDLAPTTGGADGYNAWKKQRANAQQNLGRQVGLPLGHKVEVRLYDGVVLHGVLSQEEEMLFFDDAVRKDDMRLIIGRATFRQSEIESCVRVD
jgi:hypothetical protein